jgi:hypothetical protein
MMPRLVVIIRVPPTHSYNTDRAGLGWMDGWVCVRCVQLGCVHCAQCGERECVVYWYLIQ